MGKKKNISVLSIEFYKILRRKLKATNTGKKKKKKKKKICQDFLRFINISWHNQDFLREFRLKNQDKLMNIDGEKWLNQQIIDQDREKIETFGTGRWHRDRIKILDCDRDFLIIKTSFLKASRFSRPSRAVFIFVKMETLNRDHVETNRDHQA